MGTVLTTKEANEIVFNRSKDDLMRMLKMLSSYIEKLDKPDFNEFSTIGDLSHQAMREAYMLYGIKQSAWIESESKRPMTKLEEQLKKAKKG